MSWKELRESPLDSAIVSAVGGAIILIVGAIGLHILIMHGSASGYGLFQEAMGTLWGILIIIFSILLFMHRRFHIAYGAAIIALSAASWYGTSGGLFFGFLIAFIGGIMGMVWKPRMKVPGASPTH